MEITYEQFILALIKLFKKKYDEYKKYNHENDPQKGKAKLDFHEIMERLQYILANMNEGYPALKNEKVHIGHVFGPFGFKIK